MGMWGGEDEKGMVGEREGWGRKERNEPQREGRGKRREKGKGRVKGMISKRSICRSHETHFPNKSCAIFIPFTSPGTATASPPCREVGRKGVE